MNLIYLLDLVGTFVFAISGTLAAAEKRLDIFGASVIAFVTAVGGGTIRDVLIGSQPVGWMQDLNYLLMIGLAIPIGFFLKVLSRSCGGPCLCLTPLVLAFSPSWGCRKP